MCVCVCSHVEARDQREVSSLTALHYVLRQGLSLYLDLIGSAGQVDQQAPALHLSPQCWYWRCSLLLLALGNSGFCARTAST